jgi:hypothetical protein
MSIAKKAMRNKPNLAAKHGKVPGAAGLRAKAVKGALLYQWQMSMDQKSWSDLPWSKRASTSVAGLTPATFYYFRFRALIADGTPDWSDVVSFIAH